MPQISYWGYGPDPSNRGDEAGRWTTDSVANIPSNASAITIDGQHVMAVDSDAGTRTKPAYMSQADYDYSTSKIFSAGGRSFVPEEVSDYIGRKYQAQLGSSDSFLDKAIPIAVMAAGAALTGGALAGYGGFGAEALGGAAAGGAGSVGGAGGFLSGLAEGAGGLATGIGGLGEAVGAGFGGAAGAAAGELTGGASGGASGGADASWGINPGNTGGAAGGGEVAGGATGGDIATGGGLSLGDLTNVPTGGLQGGASGGGAGGDSGGASGGGVSGGASGATSAGSALSRLMNGEATAADYASLLGTFGSTALGLLGANAQSGALKDVYNQQMALGAPSRARYEASFAPGWNIATADPSFTTGLDAGASAAARAVSAKSGNPAENPGAMAEIQDYLTGKYTMPATQTYRSINATTGQLGTNTAGTAALTSAGTASDPYSAIASGLGALTKPDNSLSSLLKQLQGMGLNYGNVVA